MAPYKVMVDDNFHYMDEDERWQLGTFETAAEAIAACRDLVDRWLRNSYKDGVTAAKLFEHYVAFGEDPFIVALEGAPPVKFSAWDFARQRAAELAAQGSQGKP